MQREKSECQEEESSRQFAKNQTIMIEDSDDESFDPNATQVQDSEKVESRRQSIRE